MHLRKQADIFCLLWKWYPSAYFHSAHILRDSKAHFKHYFLVAGEGPPRLVNMYMDSVKSNLLFSNAGCRISEAYIFRLYK